MGQGNIQVDTISGEAAVAVSASPVVAAGSSISAVSESSVTRKGVQLGSQAERLEILQQAVSNYQKAGGTATIKPMVVPGAPANQFLIVLLRNVSECPTCHRWFSGTECPQGHSAVPA